MSNIEHQHQDDTLIVWTYPANGQRFTYKFDADMNLTDKFKTENPADIAPVGMSDHPDAEHKVRVAPTMTPAVRDYLNEHGFDY